MGTSTKHWTSAAALLLGVLSSVAQARGSSRKLHHSTTTTTIVHCYNQQGELITCPVKKSSWIIAVIVIGGVFGLFALAGVVWWCMTRQRREMRAMPVSTAGATRTRRWRWPWAQKYQQVSDPEETSSTLPVYNPPPLPYEPQGLVEAHLSVPEKSPEGRGSSESYYQNPYYTAPSSQLGYEGKQATENSPYAYPAGSSSLPTTTYQPPPFPPPYPRD